MTMTAKERPPCICPGGMMNMMFRDIMERTGCPWPEAHSDPAKMAGLAAGLYDAGGFENYGVPFCMTVEAEALGAKVEMGDLLCEPRVVHSPLTQVGQWRELTHLSLAAGRIPSVLEAIRRLKARPEGGPVHALMTFVTDQLIVYGRALLAAGADAVCISDPSGTGEVVGPRFFRSFTVPYLNRVLDALNVPVKMVHICGRLKSVYSQLPDIHCDVFSFDAVVPVGEVRAVLPDRVRTLARHARKSGVDIVAPACGLPTETPLAVIRAMVDAAKEEL